MQVEVKVPQLSESVSEATLVAWHKKVGDAVKRDENLIDIETDKVVLETPAPADGVIARIVKADGETVTSGEVLAVIDTAGAAAAVAPAVDPALAGKAAAAAAAPAGKAASPSAAKLAAEKGVDTAAIAGSGRDGRVTKGDVLSASSTPAAASAPATSPAPAARPAPAPVALPSGSRPEQRVPMSRLRARVAERLVQSQSTAAILTTFNEVNMAPVMELRNRYKDRFEKEHGVKLGFMSFFVKAAVEALRAFPAVNAEVRGTDIVYKDHYDVGVAVGGGKGLVVPVVRDADRLTFAEVETTIAELARKARDNRITMDDLAGGTFTISNGGVYGSLLSTPILNAPQSGVLGLHKIQKRPVATEDGQVVVRPMMYTALSYDHRLIDGREAVGFLVRVKECLEDPERLLLEV